MSQFYGIKEESMGSNYIKNGVKSYRPVNVVNEAVAESLRSNVDVSVSIGVLSAANVGCFGAAMAAVPVSNIATTDDIVGLSVALSCTHKSPTFMHLDTSAGKHESLMDGSTNSITLSSFHSFHACTNLKSNHLNKRKR